jgi:ABC-type multidrug transport system permease subunit
MLLTYLVYRNLKETERTNDILQDIDDEAITAFFIIVFLTAAFWPFALKVYIQHRLKDKPNLRGNLVSYLVPAALLVIAASLGLFAFYIVIGLIFAVSEILIYLARNVYEENI